MPTDLIPYRDLWPQYLNTLEPGTRAKYGPNGGLLARRMGIDVVELPGALMALGAGKCNYLAMAWRVEMVGEGLAPSTINGRIQMIRSLTKALRMYGHIAWACEVGNVPGENYRDTRGCGREGYERLIESIDGDGPLDKRDRAAIRLMFGLGLRRIELYRLRMEDVDLDDHCIWVLRKKRLQRQRVTLQGAQEEALISWMMVRPGGEYVFSSAHGRLSIDWVNRMLVDRGLVAGVKARPHGLRHAGATEVGKESKSLLMVAAFLGHRGTSAAMHYLDNLEDLATQAAALIT